MAYSSALILLLSLVSQSWAYPVAQAGLPATTHTYDDGFYHWKEKTAAVAAPTATVEIPAPAVTTVITTDIPSKPKSSVHKPSSTATLTTTASEPAGTGTVPATKVAYKKFSGDGSAAAGWPTSEDWVSFEQMWANNKPIMAVACSSQNVEDNTEAEMAQLQAAILEQARATKVDARFILATIMEESTGCLRVKTTASPGDGVINPGIMQDHQGTGTCAGVAAPCPESQIKQMVKDGTAGTASIAGGGDGLQQTLAKAAAFGSDATAVYVAARIYNSGSYSNGALEANAATACYASDIANLLRGFASAQSPCKLGTA